MINTWKSLFGIGPQTDYAELIKQGAIILDVRTKDEFQRGHVHGSINIPLNKLQSELNRLKKGKPVITVCASGMRSATAKNILESNGFEEVHNAGGWMNLQSKLNN